MERNRRGGYASWFMATETAGGAERERSVRSIPCAAGGGARKAGHAGLSRLSCLWGRGREVRDVRDWRAGVSLSGLSGLSGWQNRIDRIHQMNEIAPLANGILPNGKARSTGRCMLLLAGFEPDAFGFLVWRGHELADCLKQ